MLSSMSVLTIMQTKSKYISNMFSKFQMLVEMYHCWRRSHWFVKLNFLCYIVSLRRSLLTLGFPGITDKPETCLFLSSSAFHSSSLSNLLSHFPFPSPPPPPFPSISPFFLNFPPLFAQGYWCTTQWEAQIAELKIPWMGYVFPSYGRLIHYIMYCLKTCECVPNLVLSEDKGEIDTVPLSGLEICSIDSLFTCRYAESVHYFRMHAVSCVSRAKQRFLDGFSVQPVLWERWDLCD